MIKLQNDSQPTPTNAIEIDAAILDIQSRLDFSLAWLTHGHGKTYRNVDTSRGVTLYFPEVFLGGKRYMRITPDNDKQGQSFFIVGSEQPQDYEEGVSSFLTYDLGIAFSANLELINSTLLDTEYYQQNLIQEVRRVLNTQLVGANYKLIIDEVVREFADVYSEFNVEEKRGISHAPLTHFRFNCTLTLREYCNDTPFDRCATILSLINPTERDCLANAIGGAPCDFNDCAALLAGMSDATKNTCVLPTYDFTDTDVQSNVTTQQQNDLIDWLCVPACTGDFKVDDLAHAQQIQYNVNDTVCINDTLYKAVEAIAVTGRIQGFCVDDNGIYSVSTNLNGSISYFTRNEFLIATITSTTATTYRVEHEVIIKDNYAYVETTLGGANNLGGIERIDINTGEITNIIEFSNTTGYNSFYNVAAISSKDKVIIGDELFLIKSNGGANGKGTVLKVNLLNNAVTVLADLSTTNGNNEPYTKGQAYSYNGNYIAVYGNVFATYDTTTQTYTEHLYSTVSGVYRIYDSVLVDDVLYFTRDGYNFGVLDLTNLNYQEFVSSDFAYTVFYDNVNNKVFQKGHLSLARDTFSYDIATGVHSLDTTHKGFISHSTINYFHYNGELYYSSNNTIPVTAANNTHFEIWKYNFSSKVATRVVALDGTVFVPDGINTIDVNQSPIYLELC